MSMDVFVEAIGKIDEELIDEFYSCETDKRIQIYRVMKLMAAAIAVVICIGGAAAWIGNSRGAKPQDGPIVAVQESEKPKVSREPEPTGSETEAPIQSTVPVQTIEPDVLNSDSPIVTENPNILAENTPVPDNQITPSEPVTEDIGDEATEAPTLIEVPGYMYTAWNQVECQIPPCNAYIELFDEEYFADSNKREEAAARVEPACDSESQDDIEFWDESDPRLQGWIKDIVRSVPVNDNWYWFNTRDIERGRVWNEYHAMQTKKEGIGSYSNVVLLKEAEKPESGAMYIMQVQTGALTLREANAIHQEDVFSNMRASYCNGIEMYLVENTNGELYVRFLIDDTLITIVDKGFGKDYVMKLVNHVKKVPEINWNH